MSRLRLSDLPPIAPAGVSPAEVAAALRENRIELAFQPVMQARDMAQVAFHEVLMRLRRRDGSILNAGAFLPQIERTALGRALDRRVLRLGLDFLAANPQMRLAINASPPSLKDPAWLSQLQRHLRDDPCMAERLILEITESAVLNLPDIGPCLKQLHRMGLSLALDDFGAGATSFGHFRDFRFDILKIDGRYSRQVERDGDHQILFDALLSIARHFDMLTVAEAVETHASAAYLASIGVDCLQGYALGRPAPRPLWPNSASELVS
ncbi:MAG: EAL domain-containing protein [Rhodobacteraceae bacterium]|nr:EAL domain-containing protein [Paracoccaceae bacterium]